MQQIRQLVAALWNRFSGLSRIKKLIVLAVLLVIVWVGYTRLVPKGTQSPQYQTSTVQKGTIVSSVSASGQVLAANIQPVMTQASGTVAKVYVKNGDHVTQGQTIAEITLDSSGQQSQAQAYASYLSAKSSLESAQTALYTLNSAMWQANQTFVNGAGNGDYSTEDPKYIEENSDWLAAEAKYKNQQQVIAQSQASLNSAWLNYSQSRNIVTAPAAGTITGLNIAAGMQVGSSNSSSSTSTGTSGSGQRVAAVETGGNPLISLDVNELDVPSVNIGQQVTVTLDSIPDKTFTGKVVSVDKIGSVSSGVAQYPITVQLDEPAAEILPNMSATGNVITATKSDVLIVPSGAVQQQNGQSVVRVLENGQVRNVPVETGITSDTETQIVSGLSDGQQVVTSETAATTTSGRSVFGGGGGGAVFRAIR